MAGPEGGVGWPVPWYRDGMTESSPERSVRIAVAQGAFILVAADGWPLAGPAPADTEALLVDDVPLGSVARFRHRTPRNNVLGDRRPAAYTVEPVTPPAISASSPRGAVRVASQPEH